MTFPIKDSCTETLLSSCVSAVGAVVGVGVGAFRAFVSSRARGMYPHTMGRGSLGKLFFLSQESILDDRTWHDIEGNVNKGRMSKSVSLV